MNQERTFRPRLERLWKAARSRVVLLGLLRTAAVALPASASALWVAGGPRPPGAVLLAGLGLSLSALLVLLLWDQVAAPWRRLASAGHLARRIESCYKCRNMVLAAAETEAPGIAADDPVTRELRRRIVIRAGTILDRVRLDELVPLRQGRLIILGLAAGLILLGGFAAGDPEGLARGLERLLHPAGEKTVVRRGGLYAVAGPDFVVAGEPVTVEAHDFGGGDEGAVCQLRVGAGGWQDVPAVEMPVWDSVPGVPGPYRSFQAEVEGVQEDFQWRFRRGARISTVRRIQVLHHPLLRNLAGLIVPPAYTMAQPRNLDILPALCEVPLGGHLRLTGLSNVPLTGAMIALVGGDTIPMTVDSLTVHGELSVSGEISFKVLLVDDHGLRNRDPLTYRISPLPDDKPAVRLTRPDDDGILPLGGQLSLVIEAVDDFGLRDIRLMLRPAGGGVAGRDETEGWQGGRIWPAGGDSLFLMDSELGSWRVRLTRNDGDGTSRQTRLELAADLAPLELGAGEGVELVAAARDNQEPGGGQRAWSDILRLMLPSAADVLLDQAQASEKRTSELEDARRRTRELGRDLERLTRELMKNPDPDWAKQQEMAEAIARRRDLQKQLAEMSARLQEELDRMAANQMTSERMLEQADQVSQLLEQQDNAHLDDLLQKMENRPEALGPQDLARALREVARNQQDLARRMDAALAMLKKMDREQEMEGLTALLEKIMQEQQKLAEQSRELAEKQKGRPGGQEERGRQGEQGEQGKQDEQGKQGGQKNDPGEQGGKDEQAAKELAQKQQDLAAQMKQLEDQLAAALDESRERTQNGDDSASEQKMQQTLQDILDQMKQQQAKDKMDQAGKELQQLDPEQAAKMQEQALRDLGSLYHVLLQSQSAMQMAMQQNQIKSLRLIAADLLDLSARQEEITQRIPAQLRDVRVRDVARRQFHAQQAAARVRKRLSNLSTEAPMRILALLKKLDGLIETMGYTVNALEQGQGSAAQRQSRQALAQTNKIVIGLLTEAQMNSSGGGGGSQSQPSLAEKLMRMIKEQAGLNGQTEQLRKMLADRGLSQEMRAKMKRLGDAQGNLAGRMEELARQEQVRPESPRLLGDLGRMGQDMQAVTRDMDQGLVSQETLRRQERILSRMLDARNSVRQRDYSRRRESRTARQVYGDRQQGSVPGLDDPRRFRLRYQSLDAAPPDYQGLVRRYFSALDSLQRADQAPPTSRRLP